MPLQLVRNDITRMPVDAIVNAANSSLLGGGGVDGAIHRAAGPALLAECRTLGGCRVGEAKLTGAGRLPCRYVIHTVGPQWHGGTCGEREKLTACYRNSLALAVQHGCQSVAFPLISSGVYGYPKAEALQVAVDTISAFLQAQGEENGELDVFLVIFDRASYQIGGALYADITAYIDDAYADAHLDRRNAAQRQAAFFDSVTAAPNAAPPTAPEPPKKTRRWPFGRGKNGGQFCEAPLSPLQSAAPPKAEAPCAAPEPLYDAAKAPSAPEAPDTENLTALLRQTDESFSQMLLRKIDERGMTDVQCYKKANISRKLFSKIRCDPLYRPAKPTVLAFALALELDLDETNELLQKAGYALSHAYKFDIIVEYFIVHGRYNVFEVNEALFAFDQSLLGA